MSSTFTSTISLSDSSSSSTPFPSPDPRQNRDPFESGPSIYLYGFLATLVLIFLVSVAVAWRGYYTRRILRARIDEAIARGLYVPGYSDDGTPLTFGADARRRDGPLPPRPIIWDTLLAPAEKRPDNIEWDVKPAAVTVVKPAPVPNPALTTTRKSSSNARSLLHQIVDPIRDYWFVTPPQGAHANQLQGRPDPTSEAARNEPPLSSPNDLDEKQDELKDVEGVIVNVLIAMPSPAASAQRKLDLSNQASSSSSSSRPTSTSIPTSSSRPTSLVPGHQPNEPEELPELVIGLAEFPLTKPVVVEPVVEYDDDPNNGKRIVNNGKEPLR